MGKERSTNRSADELKREAEASMKHRKIHVYSPSNTTDAEADDRYLRGGGRPERDEGNGRAYTEGDALTVPAPEPSAFVAAGAMGRRAIIVAPTDDLFALCDLNSITVLPAWRVNNTNVHDGRYKMIRYLLAHLADLVQLGSIGSELIEFARGGNHARSVRVAAEAKKQRFHCLVDGCPSSYVNRAKMINHLRDKHDWTDEDIPPPPKRAVRDSEEAKAINAARRKTNDRLSNFQHWLWLESGGKEGVKRPDYKGAWRRRN
jgi:hypothetical protein